MKKITFILGFFLLLSITNYAQVGFGIKGGLSAYTFTGDDADAFDPKIKLGAFGGFFAQLPISENFAIQPEVLYSMEGAKQEIDSVGLDGRINLSYINIPVMLRMKSISGLYVEAGPQVGFLLNAKGKQSNSSSTDIKDSFEEISFGAGLGLGYGLPIGLEVSARLNLGISDILKSDDTKFKTSGFYVGLAYNFGSGNME